jgi:uncharacterized protein (DUF2267 family)
MQKAPTAREFMYDEIWRYERFITTVELKAGISWIDAERAARATLETLGERISWGRARDLAEDVPHELRAWLLKAGGDAQPFDAREFIRRVAEREGVDEATAERHARAVFIALARLVRGEEIADLEAELPKDYEPLLSAVRGRARDPAAPEVLSIDEFLQRVADRAGLDREAARHATDAVLDTLAERVAGGQVDDMIEVLAPELRPPLERGKQRSGGKAQRMSLDEFVRRVGERERASYDDALEHARAVLATLREALPDKEFSDMLSQLPRGYQEALL